MSDPKYDDITRFYLDFVQQGLENEGSVFQMAIKAIFDLSGDLSGKQVCDLACGEGYLSRMLAQRHASVTGVDISSKLLAHARQKSEGQAIAYLQDDAQSLEKAADHTFDLVVCNLALMDIADIAATFQAVRRVLKNEGVFLFTILHPCFETPFSAPEEPVEVDAQGNFVAVRVMRYLEEGYWNSGGSGMRGKVGAYHRTLSTYFNTLFDSGFQLARVLETGLPSDSTASKTHKNRFVPALLVIKAAPV